MSLLSLVCLRVALLLDSCIGRCFLTFKQKVYAKFGITVENIVEKSKLAVDFYKHNPVPHLLARPWAHL